MAFRALGRKPQTELLKDHFIRQKRESISGVEAAAMYRIRALPRRIKDLEEAGWTFKRERRVDPTGQAYVRYIHVPHTAGLQFADR